MLTGQYVDPRAGTVTFAAYFVGWSARQVWMPGTEKAMRLAAESVPFADMPLRSIRRSHLESSVKAMQVADRGKDKDGNSRPAGLAVGTISTRFNNVRAVFRAAVRDRLIVIDPTDNVRLPRRPRRDGEMQLPSVEQVRGLLDAAPRRWQAFVALCAFGGLRLGEAAALQVGDIDFLRRAVNVQRQVQRAGGGLVEIRGPKYGSSRTVFLPDQLVTMLSAHIAEHCTGDNPGRWLFTVDGKRPPHQNTVTHWWRNARAAAGCIAVRLHDLRHFYASGLIAAGCDVVTVQRALGHSNAATTLSIYSHLWPSAEDRTRAAASDLLTATFQDHADPVRTLGGGEGR